jgi:S1-C subfamily serine protease
MELGMKLNLFWVAALAAVSAQAQVESPHIQAIDLQPSQEIKLQQPVPPGDIRRDAVVEAVEHAMPSVVNIATENIKPVRDPLAEWFEQYWNPYYATRQPDSPYSLGSGVIITDDGYLLTNNHVVQRANKIWVKLASNGNVYEARLISTDPNKDTALLKILAPPGEKFTAIKFAEEDDLLLGETVLALGNPFNLGGSVSRGILSSKARVESRGDEPLNLYNCIQTDASINPGNSGGPLVNLHGDLIGLNAVILKDAQGIGFAVPVTQINAALSRLITPEAVDQLWFGARVKPNITPPQVISVQPGSPAGIAGVNPGDTILQVNGGTPKNLFDLNQMLINSPHGDALITLARDGAPRSVHVRLIPEDSFFNADLVRRKLGVTLEKNTPETAEHLGLPTSEGFIVDNVDTNTPAGRTLQRGFLLRSIDGESLPDIKTVAQLLFAKNKGDSIHLDVLMQDRQSNSLGYWAHTWTHAFDVPMR